MSNTQYVPRIHKKRPTIRMGEVLTEEWQTTPDDSNAVLTSPIYDESKGPTTGDVIVSTAESIPGVSTLVTVVKYLPWILAGTAIFVVYTYVSSYGKATARITHPFG